METKSTKKTTIDLVLEAGNPAEAEGEKNPRDQLHGGRLPLLWQIMDLMLGKAALGLLTAFLAFWIHLGQDQTRRQIAETTQAMEQLKTELTSKRMDAQLAHDMIRNLLKGPEKERLAAMIILEHSISREFSEKIFAILALDDPSPTLREKAIDTLERHGTSPFVQNILEIIKKKSHSPTEREAAKMAVNKVEHRIRTKRTQLLELAKTYRKTGLYQPAVEVFQSHEFQKLITDFRSDPRELALGQVNAQLGNFKKATEHYETAFQMLRHN